MQVQVNGKPRALPEGTTVLDLVEELGLRKGSVVVERNGEPLARDDFAATEIAPGDTLEIVRPVQGGGSPAVGGARLYLVFDAGFPLDVLDRVLEAGVGVAQLRMKDVEAGEVIRHGEGVRDVCRAHGVPFIVNDRPDVALALEADGVHLGQDDLPPEVARRILGPDAILGRSTHSPEQIDAAVDEHRAGLADYIAVGPVHPTPTKPGRPGVGYELVRYAASEVDFPWFAIGGIDPDNVTGAVEAGAERIVVVRAIVDAPDPAEAARALREALP